MKLQPGGVAPVISYNVPEPTTYSGRNFIDLAFPASYFVVGTHPATAVAPSPAHLKAIATSDLTMGSEKVRTAPAPLVHVDPDEAVAMEAAGKRLQVYRSLSGALKHTWVDQRLAPEPSADPGARLASLMMRDDDNPYDPGPVEDPPEIEVSITSPGEGQSVSGPHTGAQLRIAGTAWTNRTLGGVSVRIGSGSFVAATRSGSSWTYDAVLTQPGWNQITARARTTGGLISDSTVSVNVMLQPAPDTTAPAVAITSPSNGAGLNTETGPMSLTVTGTAGDAGGIRLVDVSVDGAPFSPATAGTSSWSSWSAQVSLPAGNHTIKARACDNAGNYTESSVSVSVALTPPKDTAPPQIVITSPSTGASLQGPYSGATVEVTGTAADPSGVRSVELRVDEGQVPVPASPTSPGDWSHWSGHLVVVDPGPHLITALCTDGAGNVSQSSVMVNVTLVPDVVNRLNRFIIVESYRLSSYLGNYGAGRTLKTFSLLPGEKTKISIKTYTRTETDAKNASNILDSFSEESAEDFETSMAQEQSNKKNYDETWNYNVGVEAKASWGWGSASAHAEMSGGTNSAREEFAKNISNAVQKHVSKASAKREVQVNTSYEVKTQTGEETSIEREISNINVGSTLNFVFRQMNQEFISILHLVDVRVGYFRIDTVNGEEEPQYREVTLPELDTLIRDVIVPEKRAEVRNALLHQLTNVFDYKDRHHVLVEEEPFRDRDGNVVPLSNYLRMRKDYTSTYFDEASGTQITVPGVIMAANKNVLRTEGVIVEALLGHGDGLDAYSHGLQEEAVRARELENTAQELEQSSSRLALKIVRERDAELAALYRQVILGQPAPTSTIAEPVTTPPTPPTSPTSTQVDDVVGAAKSNGHPTVS